MKKTTIEKLTRKLISIPSFVDERVNEAVVGEFIYDYLKDNSGLEVERQFVGNGRFNIIAKNNQTIDTLVVGHIDTVQPSKEWTNGPLAPVVSGGRIYGLGASDMKSGIAVMLSLAVNPKLKDRTMFLFYVDEEYDFLGMRGFVKQFNGMINPKRVISLDGSDLAITNGCRGLIEISCTIKGRSGHAARPQSGVNAIVKSYQILSQLFDWLAEFTDPILGPTSSNLAYIFGGQNQGEVNGEMILGKQGNVIADICQFTLDIRPSRPELTAQMVIDFIAERAKEADVELAYSSIRHDLGSWYTPPEEIVMGELKLPFKPAGQTGYIDVQMLWKNFDQVSCFTIGAGNNMAHKPDEYVEIEKILELEKITGRLICQ